MRVLHPREVQQLLQAVNRRAPFGERDHAMLALALHTGLRVSELIGLDIRHVAHDGQPRQALHLPSDPLAAALAELPPLRPRRRGGGSAPARHW